MDTERRLTVLVLDDEALLRWSIAELPRRGGHAVLEATSAAEARDAMKASEQIDVVLLDYRLPDSDDLRLLEEALDRLPQATVVLMTAFGTPEVVEGAMDRGAYRVLSKPFDMHDLEALVTDAHRSSRYH